MEKRVRDGLAKEKAGFCGRIQGSPQGNGQRQKVGHKPTAQPVLGLFPRDRDEAAANSCPQGEEKQYISGHCQGNEEGVGPGVLFQGREQGGGGENIGGHVEHQQEGGQPPAQGKPGVAFPQGAVAQIEKGGSQKGQQVLEIEKFQAERDQYHAPDNLTDGGLPGGVVLYLRFGGRKLGQFVHQLEVKFIRFHSASPPNSVCRRLRMR